MLSVDLHVHSLSSNCGLHTILELCAQAKRLNMKGIAITDHGKTMGGRLTSVFYERFRSPYPELTVFKGIECNVTDDKGGIDLPGSYMRFLDVVLLGIHHNTKRGLGTEYNTSILIAAMEKNRAIDILTHPNDVVYSVDYRRLAEAAAGYGVALELNNSKILYSRSEESEALTLLEACKNAGCRIAINSDTHAIHELGDDSAVSPLLKSCAFPEELIVNRDAESAFAFIEERRKNKVV